MDTNVLPPRAATRLIRSKEASSAGPARSQTTRVAHLAVLLIVLYQLVGSQFIHRPLPGDPPGWLYALHEYVGLTGVAVVGAFWIWTLLRRGETRLGRLLPWFSPARLRAVRADMSAHLRRLARGRLPDDSDGALASAIHGLGLLTLSAMVLTGTVFFFTQGTTVGHDAMTAHKLVSNLMWAYLLAHAGIAMLHHLLGSDVLSRMFWPVRRRAGAAADGESGLRYSRR